MGGKEKKENQVSIGTLVFLRVAEKHYQMFWVKGQKSLFES